MERKHGICKHCGQHIIKYLIPGLKWVHRSTAGMYCSDGTGHVAVPK